MFFVNNAGRELFDRNQDYYGMIVPMKMKHYFIKKERQLKSTEVHYERVQNEKKMKML